MAETELPTVIDVPWANQENATSFKYKKPDVKKGGKGSHIFFRTPMLFLGVQVLNGGGENNLHVHPHTDEAWYVLSGKIRFYTTNDEIVGEFGRHEGVLIPKGFPYWFETADDEEAEVIRFAAVGPGAPTDGTYDRVSVDALKPRQVGSGIETKSH